MNYRRACAYGDGIVGGMAAFKYVNFRGMVSSGTPTTIGVVFIAAQEVGALAILLASPVIGAGVGAGVLAVVRLSRRHQKILGGTVLVSGLLYASYEAVAHRHT